MCLLAALRRIGCPIATLVRVWSDLDELHSDGRWLAVSDYTTLVGGLGVLEETEAAAVWVIDLWAVSSAA